MLDKPKRGIEFKVCDGEADIPHLVYLAREAHLESRFGYIPFSEEKVEKIARRAFSDPKRYGVFLALNNEEPVGMLYCSIGEYHIGAETLIATIHNINVRHAHRSRLSGGKAAIGLMNGFQNWAKSRSARVFVLSLISGVNSKETERFMERIGFKAMGKSYVAEKI